MNADVDASVARQTARNRWMLALIVTLFVAPIALAWLFVHGHLVWPGQGSLVHGRLLQPPIDVSKFVASPMRDKIAALAPSEWALVYVAATRCDTACGKTLNELRVIRSVLGHASSRLRIFAAVSAAGPHDLADYVVLDPVFTQRLAQYEGHISLPKIVVIDWRQQLMLQFDIGAPAQDIKADIKRLLRASRIK